MTGLDISDQTVQSRINGLARILERNVRFARRLVASRAESSCSRATIYRTFAPQGGTTTPAWTEPVARCVVTLLEEYGLCGPDLWHRLFQPPDLPELHDERAPATVVAPNPRAVHVFHYGVERVAERKAGEVFVFAGRLPAEFITLSVRKMQLSLWETFPSPLRRGIAGWANSRHKALAEVKAQRYLFISESVIQDVLNIWTNVSAPKKRQGKIFYNRIVNLVNADMGFVMALVDDGRLSAQDTDLLRGQLHRFAGPISNPLLRLQWPQANYAIFAWESGKNSRSPIITKQEAMAFERITSTLTHPMGADPFLDRFALLAYRAGWKLNASGLTKMLIERIFECRIRTVHAVLFIAPCGN
jgi:hypothetical protein